jgi:tetratricopeptide (TPR) repeat protein
MLEVHKKQTKMITILTTTNHFIEIENTINSIERLGELVAITTDEVLNSSDKIINVENNSIIPNIDWNDTEPPYLFPTLSFSENNLLALVFYKLGNYQKAFEYVLEDNELHQHLLIIANLQYGYAITNGQIQFLEKTSTHNLAIIYNFGNVNPIIGNNTLQNVYEEAIKQGKTNAQKLFSVKHYVNLLLDNGLYKDAEKLIKSVKNIAVSDEEKNALNHLLASSLMAQVSLPYNAENFTKIAELQIGCIQFYEKNEHKINAGLLLIDACEIASFQKDFVKSKDFINKAILYFRDEDIPEFLGEATFQKATMLYTWSKNGSPQYYKPAINTFQNALKVFKRDTHPQKFADIHHNLALIYSEIQVSENEKPIWTAFCASSFKEALQFYNKEEFPYQFAMVSH